MPSKLEVNIKHGIGRKLSHAAFKTQGKEKVVLPLSIIVSNVCSHFLEKFGNINESLKNLL